MRNVTERAFHRLKNRRGIVTRYNKKAANFLAGVCLAPAVTYWTQRVLTPVRSAEVPPERNCDTYQPSKL